MVARGAILALSLLTPACASAHFYYLENAQVEAPCHEVQGREPGIARLLDGHHIGAGDKVVLLVRKFDYGELTSVDDEIFEKLTIQIRKAEVGAPVSLDSSDVLVTYSRGGAAWISRPVGVYSSSVSGSLLIAERQKDHLRVEIDLTVEARPAKAWAGMTGRTIRIRESRVFTRLGLRDLTPWLGRCDPSIYKEVYP